MSIGARAMAGIVRTYKRYISPLLPPACRFQPTCSEYCIASLERHGLLKGSVQTLARIFRCHPLSRGGFDPVR